MTIRFTGTVAALDEGSNGVRGVRVSIRCPVRYFPKGDFLVIEADATEVSTYRIGTVVEVAITPQ